MSFYLKRGVSTGHSFFKPYWLLLFWRTFPTHSIFLRTAYLFSHSNCSHPSLEVVYLFCVYDSHPFFEVHCVVFIHCTTSCRLLSLIVICCHLLSFVVSHCHSLSLVKHSLSFIVPLVCLFLNNLYLKSFCKNKKIVNLQIMN